MIEQDTDSSYAALAGQSYVDIAKNETMAKECREEYLGNKYCNKYCGPQPYTPDGGFFFPR